MLRIAALPIIFLICTSPTQAKPLRYQATVTCNNYGCSDWFQHNNASRSVERRPRSNVRKAVELIPHPRGCPHHNFCACGLAKFWGLGSGLDAVRTWVRRFTRAYAPGPGIAAVRRDQHHIIGIVGGRLGAWEVVDFNSGGHKSRRYVRTSFEGYFFIAPRI